MEWTCKQVLGEATVIREQTTTFLGQRGWAGGWMRWFCMLSCFVLPSLAPLIAFKGTTTLYAMLSCFAPFNNVANVQRMAQMRTTRALVRAVTSDLNTMMCQIS